MRRALPYLPYVVVALVVFGWFKAHDAKVRADALAEARSDSLKQALAVLDTARAGLARQDSALRGAETRQRVALATAKTQLGAALRAADSTAGVLDSVLASLPDTAPLSIAITNERQVGAACRTALGDCEALGVTLTARVAVLDSTVNVLEPALTQTRKLWEAAERARHPSIFGRLRIAAPFVGVTAIALLLFK